MFYIYIECKYETWVWINVNMETGLLKSCKDRTRVKQTQQINMFLLSLSGSWVLFYLMLSSPSPSSSSSPSLSPSLSPSSSPSLSLSFSPSLSLSSSPFLSPSLYPFPSRCTFLFYYILELFPAWWTSSFFPSPYFVTFPCTIHSIHLRNQKAAVITIQDETIKNLVFVWVVGVFASFYICRFPLPFRRPCSSSPVTVVFHLHISSS